MNLFEFAENLKNYPVSRFLDDFAKELENTDEDAFKSLIENQWDNGVDGNERPFPVYALSTQEVYARLNPPIKPKNSGSNYNLMWSGKLFNQTNLLANKANDDVLFEVDSQSESKKELFERLSRTMSNPFDIFKLIPKNQDKFTAIAQDTAIEILNKNLKLK